MLASRLTSKYQTTIPEKIRKLLDLHRGDLVAFRVRKNRVTLNKTPSIDLQFAKSLESTLSEWTSEHDEEAYRDL